MSPSSSIRRRHTRTKGTRYQVRFRPGGRDTDWISVATFSTLKEARSCKAWADGEIAAGRRPNLAAHLAAQAPTTVAEVMERYGATQTEPAQEKRHRNTTKRLGKLGRMPVDEVTGRDVQAWIDAQATGKRPLAASSIAQYLGQIRRAFDWIELNPNPAAWSHLRTPHQGGGERDVVDPPTLAEYEAVMSVLTPLHHRPLFVVIEGTGMRISEALRLTWGDIDWRRHRIRVPGSKTRAARRWVPLWGAAEELLRSTPREDRIAKERIFARSTDNGARSGLSRACTAAEVRHLHPHDLRDRFISLCDAAGIPLPLIRDMAGHMDNTTTLDIYTGLIVDEPRWRLEALRTAVARMTGLDGGAWVGSQKDETPANLSTSRGNIEDGGYRDRTGDLRAASATLSQLS